MRRIGTLDQDEQASTFSNYLNAKQIHHLMEATPSGGYDVWIHDEDRVSQGRDALNRYRENPGQPEFLGITGMTARRHDRAREQPGMTIRPKTVRRGWLKPDVLREGLLTRVLLVVSVVATMLGGLGFGKGVTQALSMTAYEIREGSVVYDPSLPELSRGEVWRLITPIFLHATPAAGEFAILHLLFNMLWLLDLGTMVEKAHGLFSLLGKVLLIGAVSNIAQLAVAGPAFGGMSGVVFGLLGYCWVRGRLDLTSGLYVGNQTMLMMTVWFVLCLTGMVGHVANAAHMGGVLMGLAWGWLSAWKVNHYR